jgi:WD40 repeat protein
LVVPVVVPKALLLVTFVRGFNNKNNKKGSAANKNNKKGAAGAAAFKYVLATGGADGVVFLWGCDDPNDDWTVVATLDHASCSHFQATREQDDSERPQVYALQFIDHWQGLAGPSASATGDNVNSTRRSILMTSSDDHVHLWEVNSKTSAKKSGGSCLKEVFSLRFGATGTYGSGVTVGHVTGKGVGYSSTARTYGATAAAAAETSANDRVFGGSDRNPQGLVYVFDACYCPANGLLGVALSDGTLRLIYGRGNCLAILQLPSIDKHLTSLAWDSSGQHLATSVASGQVITWAIDCRYEQHQYRSSAAEAPPRTLQTSCRAVLEGGHESGRPLFGVQYCGTDDSLLLSWGVDGRLCLWDAHSEVEQVSAYVATLLDKKDYPIYCVSLSSPMTADEDDDGMVLAVGGGADSCGLKGIPVYLYNIPRSVPELNNKKVKTTNDEN